MSKIFQIIHYFFGFLTREKTLRDMETEVEMKEITEARNDEDAEDNMPEIEAMVNVNDDAANEYQKLQVQTEDIYSVATMPNPSPKHNKDVHSKARMYWRISVFLLVLCLILLAVVLALAVKLNDIQSSQPCSEREKVVDRTPVPAVCSQEVCQSMYPPPTVQTSGHQCSECRKNWLSFENSCYFISQERLTWQKSREMCQKLNGDLVVINNERVQKFLTEKGGMMYWIGLMYSDTKKWMWINNTTLTQSYWNPDHQQNNMSGQCALLLGRKPFMRSWYLNPCNVYSQYICQRDYN